jgi:serine/threonine protein kinase
MGQQESTPGAAGGGGATRQKIEDKYFLQKVKLGQGSFGTVWRAVDRTNDRVVAVKQLEKAQMPKRGVSRKDIEREVELIKAVRDENVTKLYDYYEDDKSIYLALEYCDGGDFGDKVKERGMNLREEDAQDWMAQICSAIRALHAKGICHRDIKPDNFMVAGVTLKLSDFGLACFLPRGKLLTDKCGTPAFMSPEQMRLGHRNPNQASRGYSFPCDMWAAGISMYMLMFGGRHPFLTAANQLDEQMLLQGRLDFTMTAQPTGGFFGGLLGGPAGNLRFSDGARSMCKRMVEPAVERRITAEDALRDRWLADLKRRASTTSVRSGEATPQGRQTANSAVQPEVARRPSASDNAAQFHLQQQQLVQQQAAAKAAEDQQRIRSLERKITQLQQEQPAQNALPLVPPKTSVPQKGGVLRPGLRCRYQSGSWGWMPGFVQSTNDQDGTFNLDVRQHAVPEKIAPIDQPSEQNDVWPNGTWVWYQSTSMANSLPGVILGYNAGDNTYNLDVREHAAIDRIRARIGETPPSFEDPGRPFDGMRTEKAQGATDFEGYMPSPPLQAQPPVPVQAMAVERPDNTHGQQLQRQSSSQPRPPDGSKCLLQHQGQLILSIIEGFNQSDGTYSLLVDPSASRRRQQVRPENIRAPRDVADAWPPGTGVMYESSSFGNWFPGVIISFNTSSGTYNLDVREGAQPDRVRPR